MRNLLFGNGININFSGNKFTNKFIIIRAINNIKNKRYPRNAYTKETLPWLNHLYKEFNSTKNGENDNLVFTSFEKEALEDFKNRYQAINNPKIYDIGFEDYFLLHDIFCYKNNINNPERFEIREALKRMFLDAIYFKGEILKIHKKFPKKLIDYFNGFDSLFTTNYDNNVEKCCNKQVHYLHGAFHILDDVYNPDSFRNQLSDTRNESFSYVKNTPYLFSNALSTYTGELKEYLGKQNTVANSAMEKFVNGYTNDLEIKKEIEKLKESDNDLVKKLYEAIKLKSENNKYSHEEYYPMDELLKITDSLTIIGLSPFNDSHIFNSINKNNKLDKITYYFFDKSERISVNNLLTDKEIDFQSVTIFWSNINT